MALRFNLPAYRLVVIVLLAVTLLGLLAVPGCSPSFQPREDSQREVRLPPSPKIGYPAPDFTLVDLEGNQVKLGDLRGKSVFLNFWATWCPPCRAEMPEIEYVYQKYKDKGAAFIGVNILVNEIFKGYDESDVRQFVQQGGYSWTFVLDSTGEVTNSYAVFYIPASFFIDKEGIVRGVRIGALNRQTIEAELTKAMR